MLKTSLFTAFSISPDATIRFAKRGQPMITYCRDHLSASNSSIVQTSAYPQGGFLKLKKQTTTKEIIRKVKKLAKKHKRKIRLATIVEALLWHKQRANHNPPYWCVLGESWEGYALCFDSWLDKGMFTLSPFESVWHTGCYVLLIIET